MSAIGEVLHGGPVDADEIARVRDVVMFEEPGLEARLVRFWALLVLSSAIAAFGLYADSVAAVIGAMIVAPLMLPIMGLAFGISIGERRAVISSIVVSLGGIATAILVGYLISFLVSQSIEVTSITQIMSRTSPRLIDLLAALATGLAGAFAIGRRDVSDTLPGVAIAISLVPPLANVGILLGVGHVDLAMGSLLLFMTNYLAILITGSFVFGLMGYPSAALEHRSRRVQRTARALIVIMVMVIVVPLGVTSLSTIKRTTAETRAADATKTWVAGSGYRFVSATASDDSVDVVIAGSGDLPEEADLKSALADNLLGFDVLIEAVPSTSIEFTTD